MVQPNPAAQDGRQERDRNSGEPLSFQTSQRIPQVVSSFACKLFERRRVFISQGDPGSGFTGGVFS